MILLKSDWGFKDIQENIETIKTEYDGILLSFSFNQMKEKCQFTHNIRNQVFSLTKMQYWQRERLWETMNNDLEIEKFKKIRG